MSTRSGLIRVSVKESSPSRTRKGTSPSRSPARIRKTPENLSRKNSPARKSPSRKRTSPSRKPPPRKSPSRVKETNESITQIQKSPSKRASVKADLAVKLEDFSSKLEIYRSTRSKRLEYSVKDVTSTTDDFATFDNVNGITLDEDLRMEKRKSVEEVHPRRRSSSKSFSKSVSQSIDNVSDGEISADEHSNRNPKHATRKLATPVRLSESKPMLTGRKWEFGGRIGTALLILLIPMTVLCILISCEKSCSTISVQDLIAFKSLNTWFSQQTLILVLSQFALQGLFAITPIFGINADRLDDTGRKYCFNGIFSCVVTILMIYILDFLYVFDTSILLSETIKFAVISYVIAVFLSIIMYIKSKYVDGSELNSYGNTGSTLYDFFMGREIHPCLKQLDIKIWISRVSNFNTLILISLIFRHALEVYIETLEMQYTLPKMKALIVNMPQTNLLYSSFQLVYILNYVMKEHQVTTTFFWHSEGVGYLQIVSSALYPFYFSSMSKHVADNKLVLPDYILMLIGTIFLVGLILMLNSNNTKHDFRTKPYDLFVSKMESMPTFHGKKLLLSSMWGYLRHPNYTGDILMHIAFAIPGLASRHVFAALPALLTILMLIHRARRVDSRCNRRYGAAWARYCKKVPSPVIPGIP